MRHSIARRGAPGYKRLCFKALKGRHNYVALSGLVNRLDIYPARCAGLLNVAFSELNLSLF
ncbi:MAG: hypothetical protein MSG64_09495 [Pyrinomonadaceae bacterium MAG19_C2-C3]|nr:hypothetical protein [Pyrinomonadaceae bacterium MAG19_C2-C3]